MTDVLRLAYDATDDLTYFSLAAAMRLDTDGIRRPARTKAERRRIRRMWWLCSSFADSDELAPGTRAA